MAIYTPPTATETREAIEYAGSGWRRGEEQNYLRQLQNIQLQQQQAAQEQAQRQAAWQEGRAQRQTGMPVTGGLYSQAGAAEYNEQQAQEKMKRDQMEATWYTNVANTLINNGDDVGYQKLRQKGLDGDNSVIKMMAGFLPEVYVSKAGELQATIATGNEGYAKNLFEKNKSIFRESGINSPEDLVALGSIQATIDNRTKQITSVFADKPSKTGAAAKERAKETTVSNEATLNNVISLIPKDDPQRAAKEKQLRDAYAAMKRTGQNEMRVDTLDGVPTGLVDYTHNVPKAVGGAGGGAGGAGASLSELARMQIEQGYFDKDVLVKTGKTNISSQQLWLEIQNQLLSRYGGDRKKASEARQIMERNQNRSGAVQRMADAASMARDSLNTALLPAMERWVAVRDRLSPNQRKQVQSVLGSANKQYADSGVVSGEIYDKLVNKLTTIVKDQQLSKELLEFEAAAFGAIRQVNQGLSTRGAAQKSLDMEHKFWSASNSAEGLRSVMSVFDRELQAAERAYGIRPLPKTKEEESAAKRPPAYSDPNSKNPRRVQAVGVVEAMRSKTSESDRNAYWETLKKSGWSKDQITAMAGEAGWF